MSLRILVAVLFVGGCSGRQPLPTTPPPHVAWVPEVRALLGHVEDDALADFDAELARVRAIARFELETEDPDHEGVLRLLRLHRFDVDDAVGRGEEAVRVARARAVASGDALVGSLMLAGRDAFETILWVAPELLVARPEPFDRFLRSAFPLAPDALCAVTTRGFFIDRMTYMLECEGLVDARLAGVWGALDPTLRALLRARGRIAPGDALTGPEAALLVDASFWGAQASLHLALQRGDAASAAHLARVLVVRDPDNVPARLVLALEREIATGVIAGDAGTVQWLVHLFGPAYLAHRFPESNVTKLVLLERFARQGLRQDYARVRAELPDSSLALLGPLAGVLDTVVRRRSGEPPRELDALRSSSSPTLRAYGLAPGPDDHDTFDPTFGEEVWSPDDVEAMLAFELPPSLLWWLRLSSLPFALRERIIDGADSPLVASRARRVIGCRGANMMDVNRCASVSVGRIDALAAIDLDWAMLRALEATPYWNARALEALFARLDGGPVSSRGAYVLHRIKALISSGDFDEARRRLDTDGRVLTRSRLLLLDAMLLDAASGNQGPPNDFFIPRIETMLAAAIVEGCPLHQGGEYQAAEPPLEEERVVEAMRRTMAVFEDEQLPIQLLRPFVSRFGGRSKQTILLVLAFDSLMRRDREAFETDIALAGPAADSQVAHLMMEVASSVFPSFAAPEANAWIAAWFRRGAIGSADIAEADPVEATLPTSEGAAPDASRLSRSLAEAYAALGSRHEAAVVERFLRTRADDDNARRVQCRVALDSLGRTPWLPGFLRVELPRERRAQLDRAVGLCRHEPATTRFGMQVRGTLARWLPGDGGVLPAAEYRRDTDESRSLFTEIALTQTPVNYGLARLTELSPSLTLVLEGRLVDAREAATGSARDLLRARLLREDLETRRIDVRVALALLWLQAGSEGAARLPYNEIVEHLFSLSPRSKFLALTVATRSARGRDTPFAVRARHANACITAAGDDVELLIHMADAFRRAELTTQAERVIARVRTLEPNARTTLDEEEPDCAPE